MKWPAMQKRTLALLAVLLPLAVLFLYVALTSGPLAPVPVIAGTVENRSIAPALFGIGTIEARFRYRIGPTFAGRVQRLEVDVGDQVQGGQVIGEMDPVDLDDRLRAMDAAQKRAEAQLREAEVRNDHARKEAHRYQLAFRERSVSEEIAAAKQQENLVTEEGLKAAREELSRIVAERQAVKALRTDLKLVAPVGGLVVSREGEPGTTVVAGQVVVEMIDPASVWVDVRFDQITAQGLKAGLPARILLRSQENRVLTGRILRVEPLADAVTEETLAKVIFDELPEPLPPIGELTEVTVSLPTLPEGPVIPNAALQRSDGQLGVWQVAGGKLRFTQVVLGSADLDGRVQVRQGLQAGDRIVVYSEKALSARSRIKVVEHLSGVEP
ncbi:MAG: efflux RND transporter periplasmic adaptor subunit [Desulfuromonadaceae bacterium]|nr:efflux RND transporter periplasmic adaptor subunit [Desulfuromonadaceae bacterium]